MNKIDHTITIDQLLDFCKKQVARWNWNKKILISSDDEWNSYHNLYYAFTDDYDEINELQNFCDIWDITDDLENYVILW